MLYNYLRVIQCNTLIKSQMHQEKKKLYLNSQVLFSQYLNIENDYQVIKTRMGILFTVTVLDLAFVLLLLLLLFPHFLKFCDVLLNLYSSLYNHAVSSLQ